MKLFPLSYDQKVEYFGDPMQYVREDGSVRPEWEEKILVKIDLPRPMPYCGDRARLLTSTRCHRLIASSLSALLSALFHDQEVWNTINDWGGCYNFRSMRRVTGVLSSHCWAIAADADCADNPFGHHPKVHPRLESILNANGFLWGGGFSGKRRDGMHWEFYDVARLK
jgi:hypothetical protein